MSRKILALFTMALVLAMVYWSHADTVITKPGAPISAPYLTKTPVSGLTAEEALSTKATGCLASTTSTGAVNTRVLTGTTNQITVTNGDCSANPTLSLSSTLVIPGPGIEFSETAGDSTCAAGNYWIKANSTTGNLRKCQNGTVSDLAGSGTSAGASGALQASNGSGGFVDSGVTASFGVLTASQLILTGGALGSGTFLAGTTPSAPSNALEVTYFFDSTTLRLGSIANGGSAKWYVTEADTQTLTNKTLDAEATGNVLTIKRRKSLRAARCNGTTAGLGDFELPSSGAAALACINGTTVQGVLDFVDGSTTTAQYHEKLSPDWTGQIDVVVDWQTTATTGNVVFAVRTSCSGPGEAQDPGWGSTVTIVDAAQATNTNHNDITKTNISTAGCAPGEWFHLEFGRDGANGSDTLAATARVKGVEILERDAQ